MRPEYFVYVMTCYEIGWPLYVKVGMSLTPTQRLNTLHQGSPVTPRQFFFAAVGQWFRPAHKIEVGLHKHFGRWRHRGEWFLVPRQDEQAWKEAWDITPSMLWDGGRKLRWMSIDVNAILAAWGQHKSIGIPISDSASRRRRVLARRVVRGAHS